MKKYFNLTLIILALILCLSLAACADGGYSTVTPEEDNAQSERVAIHTVALDVDAKDIAD